MLVKFISQVSSRLFLKQVYPCAFAIMSNKSKDAYVAAFNAISNQVGGMNPVKVMCDFDVTLRDACRECFYGAEVVGCWFHYTQASIVFI